MRSTNPVLHIAMLAISAMTALASGCSTSSTSATRPDDSGAVGQVSAAASISLQDVKGAAGIAPCPDFGTWTLAILGPDGVPRRALDGVDGAVASCHVSETSFDVSASIAGMSVTAKGDLSGGSSSHAQVSLTLGARRYSTAGTDGCTVTFGVPTGAGGGDGLVYARLDCPVLRSDSGSAGCATSPGAYVDFLNCQR